MGHNRAGLLLFRGLMDTQYEDDWKTFRFNPPEDPEYQAAYDKANKLLNSYGY